MKIDTKIEVPIYNCEGGPSIVDCRETMQILEVLRRNVPGHFGEDACFWRIGGTNGIDIRDFDEGNATTTLYEVGLTGPERTIDRKGKNSGWDAIKTKEVEHITIKMRELRTYTSFDNGRRGRASVSSTYQSEIIFAKLERFHQDYDLGKIAKVVGKVLLGDECNIEEELKKARERTGRGLSFDHFQPGYYTLMTNGMYEAGEIRERFREFTDRTRECRDGIEGAIELLLGAEHLKMVISTNERAVRAKEKARQDLYKEANEILKEVGPIGKPLMKYVA